MIKTTITLYAQKGSIKTVKIFGVLLFKSIYIEELNKSIND